MSGFKTVFWLLFHISVYSGLFYLLGAHCFHNSGRIADFRETIKALEPKESKIESQSEFDDRLAASETSSRKESLLSAFKEKFKQNLSENKVFMKKLGHLGLQFNSKVDEKKMLIDL